MLIYCYWFCWYSAVAQTWVGLVMLTIFMMNFSSIIDITDCYYSLVYFVHNSMLVSYIHSTIVVKWNFSIFLLQ